MKQEAQAAHVRKDLKLPSDTTVQSVTNSVRFAVRSQSTVLFQVTPRYLIMAADDHLTAIIYLVSVIV